jgi:uncharacterized protein with HEPN domain
MSTSCTLRRRTLLTCPGDRRERSHTRPQSSNVEIIGEAAKALPDEVVANVPGIDWRKIRGMRDVLARAYLGVDPKVVWDVALTKADPLGAAARALIE